MYSIIAFFVFTILFVVLFIKAEGDEVKEARVARLCFGTLAGASVAITILAIVAGAPASVMTLAGVVTALTSMFTAFAVKAVKEAEARAAEAEAESESLASGE